MPSELRSAASRANGAKSQGPKSDATRETSSRNSLKHGLTSTRRVVLTGEDPDRFQQFFSGFMDVFSPANAVEEDLVQQMVAARWRTMRIWGVETGLFDDQMIRQHDTIEEQFRDPASNIPLARAFRTLTDESHALSLAFRYESRLHRVYQHAYTTLRQLQRERQPQPTEVAPCEAAPPEPPSDPVPSANAEPVSFTPADPPQEKSRNEPSASRTLRQLRNHRALGSRSKNSGTPRASFGTGRFLGGTPAKRAPRAA
jgi:hypothetical protein